MGQQHWVLGDADVAKMWREFLVTATLWPHNASNAPWDFARAIEAAVIAKMEKRLVNAWGKPCISIEQAEREARKRERKAWNQGARAWESARVSGKYTFPTDDEMRPLLDREYPLPACDKCGQELP